MTFNFENIYKLRPHLNLSLSEFNETIKIYFKTHWRQTLVKRIVNVQGYSEERLFAEDVNESKFIHLKSFLKIFDQGTFNFSEREIQLIVRSVMSCRCEKTKPVVCVI